MNGEINNSYGRMIGTDSFKDGKVKKNYEFWGSESLKKRPLSEQYPRLEDETDNQYNDRLQEIQDLTEVAQVGLSDEDKREIEEGAYTEESGHPVIPNYKKFGVKALKTFDMIENDPELVHSDEKVYNLRRQLAQEEKANYYIRLYQQNQPDLSEFSGLAPENRLHRDQLRLQRKEGVIDNQSIWNSPNESSINDRMSTWDRVAEAVLYPLALNFGLFDYNITNPEEKTSGQCRARAIYPSKFDDLFHGVDAAFMVPTGISERGKVRYVPVTFDCTTSETHLGIDKKFRNVSDDGITRIDYAKTEDGDLITDIRPLNFIIGLSHSTLIGDQGLMRSDNIARAPRGLFHNIYVQIYWQARLRLGYFRLLQFQRADSKDTKMTDVLSDKELMGARQADAVRNFFRQKCIETAADKEHPFSLMRNYSGRPSSLVDEKTLELLSAQRDRIEEIKMQKGWQ